MPSAAVLATPLPIEDGEVWSIGYMSVLDLRGLLRGWAILETTGRRSGKARRTPVGNGLEGDMFWIVAEHGRKAAYVRDIEVNPRVRVKMRGRWRGHRASTARRRPAGSAAQDRPQAERRHRPSLWARSS